MPDLDDRLYVNRDILGVELCGALKNIVAIAAGAADGLGFGDNGKAGLMTRGLAEMARLGVAVGANPLTFAGLAGIGDLIATCGSTLSRNHRPGVERRHCGAGGRVAALIRIHHPWVEPVHRPGSSVSPPSRDIGLPQGVHPGNGQNGSARRF